MPLIEYRVRIEQTLGNKLPIVKPYSKPAG
jgi:hypothetical protein